ncbi:hypothetical protein EDD17DRAFT_930732 [Pisolithus thermaeus]|nr:hypothetical protein EDD17DRAFT_930732 [Pisolithus thermaeus]
MHRPTGTEPYNFTSRQKKDTAIKFFTDLFGLKHAQNFIGRITFFARFPSMMKTSSTDIAASEDGLRGGRQFTTAESDSRLEAVLPLLHNRCQILCKEYDSPRRHADERQRLEDEIKSISQTLGAELLEHIVITARDTYHGRVWSSKPTGQPSHVKYDRQLNTPSLVQDIKALQVKLDATKGEDEQRALEEDITGKARAVSADYFLTLRMVRPLIDPVALLVWDLRRSG